MWPETEEQVAIERLQINQLLEAYQPLIQKTLTTEPDFIEISALATMLHSFYTGLENIFKRIAHEIDGAVPSGPTSHVALLIQMSRATANRPAVISESLKIRLSAFLGFRHVFRHAYSFQLDWEKMRNLVSQSQPTWQEFQEELDLFFS